MRLHTTSHSRVHAHTDHAAEVSAAGPYACTNCTYVVTAYRDLPTCPMCGERSWSTVAGRVLHPRQAPGTLATEWHGERRPA